jgi:hypothetical protein
MQNKKEHRYTRIGKDGKERERERERVKWSRKEKELCLYNALHLLHLHKHGKIRITSIAHKINFPVAKTSAPRM